MRIRIKRVLLIELSTFILFFSLYGLISFVHDAKHKALHYQEVTITTEELEEIISQNQRIFLTEDDILSAKLQTDYYKACSKEEQLEILSLIAAREAEYLGITVPTVKLLYLEENIGGYYNDDTHHVILNQQYITHEKCSIEAILHEMFHAYQYACIQAADTQSDLLWAREIAKWKEENSNISNDFHSNEGLVDYYTAASEESARKYAEARMEIYAAYIDN